MTRRLKIDPRPPSRESVVEATVDDRAAEEIVDDIECATWRPVTPGATAAPSLAFVDGVQQYDRRFSAEGEGWPIPGILASFAAGAACPGASPPIRHVAVERRIIIAKGARVPEVRLTASNTSVEYRPAHNAGEDAESLDVALGQLRAELEAVIVRNLIEAQDADLVVVDGRLPPNVHGNAVGFIKTPHRVPLSKQEQIQTIMDLGTGQRSPVFLRQRSDRRYYSWFVCLRKPAPSELSLSGLALLEMAEATPLADALRTADQTAALLPAYASTPYRDERSPQNLLPVGQLERELRHRLGDRELLQRLITDTFAREEFAWEP